VDAGRQDRARQYNQKVIFDEYCQPVEGGSLEPAFAAVDGQHDGQDADPPRLRPQGQHGARHPTNFFTASALNGRAGDLSNLLDSLSSGIKTIEAADNGLKSITRTVESMQSTLRQARQDKSFKSESFAIPEGMPTGSEQLTLAGGALGVSTAIDLTTGSGGGGGQPVYSLAAADFSPVDFAIGPMALQASFGGNMTPSTFAANDTLDITIDIDGVPSTFSISAGDVQAVGNGDGTIDSGFEFADIINAKFEAANAPLEAISTAGTSMFIRHTQLPVVTGTTISVSETAHQGSGGTVTALGLGALATTNANAATMGITGMAFTLTIDGGTPTFLLISDDPLDGDDAISTIQELASSINEAYGSTIATINGGTGAMEIASPTTGSGSSVRISSVFNGLGSAGGLTNSPTAVGTAAFKSVDALVSEINGNSAINNAVRASNDNGKLRIENLSTADMSVSGALGAASIAGNDVRANLVGQFNDLRDQLDKFVDDASFNGINLLRGDRLKLTFNEVGTSTIEIQAKDAAGQARPISSLALGLAEALESDFDSDADLDTLLDTMKGALDTLRSQSSAFGSNLSVVENRNDFTKSMINTLETGAANLTLADTNQEAANLLALQTRQQLSSSALSMASQADQAVLRLF
jgi:hypothetical protein